MNVNIELAKLELLGMTLCKTACEYARGTCSAKLFLCSKPRIDVPLGSCSVESLALVVTNWKLNIMNAPECTV